MDTRLTLWRLLVTALAAIAGLVVIDWRRLLPASLLVLFSIVAAYCIYQLVRIEWRSRRRSSQHTEKRFRRFISDGITSEELVERQVVNDRAEATLRIRPTNPAKELPQPLELLVASTEIGEVLGVKHYPSETDDVDQGYPDAKRFFMDQVALPPFIRGGLS